MSDTDRAARRPADPPAPAGRGLPSWARWLSRSALWLVALAAAGAVTVVVLVGIALAVAYPNLPEIGGLMDYRPKLPMRVFSADGVLLGEYGEERRNFLPLADIPKVIQHAVLASEDARFYEHSGVDVKGVSADLTDEAGRLDLAVRTPIRVVSIRRAQEDPGSIDRSGGSVLARAGRSEQAITDQVAALTGSTVSRLAVRLTGAEIKQERRVR